MSLTTPHDAATYATIDLIQALNTKKLNTTITIIGNEQLAALRQLADIFEKTTKNTTTTLLEVADEPTPSVYFTWQLSSAEDKNFPFCPQLRTQKTYGKQMLLSKPSTMAYLTMVVLPSWQLLTQYYTN